MTDCKTPLEGAQPPLRHRSLSTSQYPYDSLNYSSGSQPARPSETRRRPSRTNSNAKISPQTTSPSQAEPSKTTKSGQNTLKKPPRRDSLCNDATSALHGGAEQLDEEALSAGFVPRLSQIQEGKLNSTSRSRGSSTIEPKNRRRRHSENDAVSRTRARHKHGPLQRQAESPTKLANPSLVSVLSGETQLSSASSGRSNSTVTQKSYDDLGHMTQYEPGQARQRSKMARSLNTPTLSKLEATQVEVFKYMQEAPKFEQLDDESVNDMPSSTTASSSPSSSSDIQHDDELSSNAGELQDTADSLTISPASTRASDHHGPKHNGRGYGKAKVPLYASSFVHGHGDEDEHEVDDEEEREEEEDSSTESEEEFEEYEADPDHVPSGALEKVSPPRVPSTSSRHSDPHTRRLRQLERELANHVLQSPQPHKEFQFAAEPPANAYAPIPLYSPRTYSGASPANSTATADPVSGWPTMPPLPPPLPIGYSPHSAHQSPETGHPMPPSVWPPIGAPEGMVQQVAPPFQHQLAQPPHYQARTLGPDLSKTTVVGYELLADKLSEPSKVGSKRAQARNLVPMYRKFERLNHRVLLHLQDEVCELEEELRCLDECIAQTCPRDETGHWYPASRRGDARYGGEVHYKRTELLGRIFQKLGQYNQALSSFNNLLRDLDSSTAEDVRAYRTWMDKRLPIDYAESRFLDHETDLLAVSRRTSLSTARGAGQHCSAGVWFPLVLVLPLVLFAIVPSLLGRLLVIFVIGGAGLKVVTSTAELAGFMTMREWTMAASFYFGVMALLAVVVR